MKLRKDGAPGSGKMGKEMEQRHAEERVDRCHDRKD